MMKVLVLAYCSEIAILKESMQYETVALKYDRRMTYHFPQFVEHQIIGDDDMLKGFVKCSKEYGKSVI